MTDAATASGPPAFGVTGASGAAPPRLVLSSFEGPLDLLLHLIRTNEIDITNIPIHEICLQYDVYLGLMRDLNLEVAGDYLVMASTLAHIKSRMLLPAPPAAPGQEAEDPRAELIRQLLEHQRAKAAAEALRERDEAQANAYLRGHAGEDPLGPYRQETELEVSLFDLLSAFRRLMENLGGLEPLHVRREEISVADKIAWIMDRLETVRAVTFIELIVELPSRAERIVAFLAILELLRLRLITATQRRTEGEILITMSSSRAADESTGGHDDEG